MRIAPGVRISASSRGIRAGIGPRAARIHVGSGRTGFSTGAGPFTYYTSARGGRRSSGGGRQMSQASYERAIRQAEKEELAGQIEDLERRLVSAHLEEFKPATEYEPAPPTPVSAEEVLTEMVRQEVAPISVFRRAERRQAKERAHQMAEVELIRRNHELQSAYEAESADARAAWLALEANDPEAVLGALEVAFEDNSSPAAAVNCEGAEVQIVMIVLGVDLILDQKPAVTAAGRPTLKKRTKTEINELYLSYVASHVLATVREAFAVAPSIQQAKILVVRNEVSAGLGDDRIVALFAGTFTRALIEGAAWDRMDLTRVLDEVPDSLLRRVGRTGEIAPLDLGREPDLEEIVDRVKLVIGDGE